MTETGHTSSFIELNYLKAHFYRKNSSPKSGYQKLSSSSFAEDRVGRAQQRETVQLGHARTGSSPASMIGNFHSLFTVNF